MIYIEGEDRIVEEIARQLCMVEGIDPDEVGGTQPNWLLKAPHAREHYRMHVAMGKATHSLKYRP